MGRYLAHDWFPQPVPDNVVVGARSYLHSSYSFKHYRSARERGVVIGHDTAVNDGTMFDLGPAGAIEIGDHCVVNAPHFVTNARIVIGDYVHISYEVFLSDDPSAIPPVDPAAPLASGGGVSIEVGDDCWLGLRSVLLQGAVLGQGVIVGANSVVDFEVPPFAVVAGNPAQIVGWARPEAGELT
jgi:acetyltransferase-like isoleucine patch superfamily enzyme